MTNGSGRLTLNRLPAVAAETLLDRLCRHAADAPGRPAYVLPDGKALTYGDLHDRVESAAASAKDGVLRGGTGFELPVRFLAGLRSNGQLLLLPCDTQDLEASQLRERASLDSSESSGWSGIVLATSGSTATPNLVRRSARSLDAVARNVAEVCGMTPNDRVLATVPLAHSYGLEHGLLGPIWGGATVLLCPGLDQRSLAAHLERRPTIIPAIPAMIELLPRLGPSAGAVREAHRVYSAGAPLPPGARDRFRAAFDQNVGQVYGMTEIGSVTFNDPRGAASDPDSVGLPMNGVSIRVLDGGEVAVRSTCMFDGYADAAVELVDGHLPTGDLGRVDEAGRLFITGRRRLLIEAGGRKVNPLEIEAALCDHPDVAQCVVVPVRQSETSTRLRAVIVPRGERPAAGELRQFVRARLAGWKVPRLVEFRDALPTTASGKIARAEVEASSCE